VIELALVVAFATLAAGCLAALVVRRLPTLRLRLSGLALVAVVLPLAAVSLSGVVMFQEGHDVVLLGVAAASATVAFAAALLVGTSITRPLERLRSASSAVARGDLTARAPEQGPTEVAEVAASFNEMAESLDELFDARRQLVAWASHDLRTPLSSLQAMLEAVEDGLAPPERYLPAMREQVSALGTLIDDLFELARIDADAITFELRDAPVSALVQACLRGLEAEARSRHITLEARVNAELLARCAPEKVERVLVNLLTNSLRHTPTDGSVAVFVEPLANEVQVTVEDTGEGIPPESLQRAFERFWRADRARSRAGAGLGLAIARGLVEAQGGRIWAESRPGGGARVRFTLPSAPAGPAGAST
jgi:signal transduction histidine kinase